MPIPSTPRQLQANLVSLPEGVSIESLPETARELITIIGIGPTMKLIEACGGQRFLVPKGVRTRGQSYFDELAEIVGREAAEKMGVALGGRYLAIPNCKKALGAVRRNTIVSRFDAMTTGANALSARAAVNRLATEFGLCSSTIWRSLKRCL